MVLEVGAEFAGYAIESVLGAGGMGVVYLARHPRLGRMVALKVLNESLGTDPGVRQRFEREAALAASLQHPNIVPVYDRSGPEDSRLWIVMQHIGGGDVAGLIATQGGRLPAPRAVHLITGAARGIDFAHRHGVLHRDIKPANLLVEYVDGIETPLVADFGIARTLDDTATLSALVASFGYTAPERFRGLAVDPRTDVYSLGCTLYEMLTGTAPFPYPDQAAVIGAHLSEPPPQPSRRQPGLPPGLDTVIAIAMAKDPEDRYPDCGALAADAARVLNQAYQPTVLAGHSPQPAAPAQYSGLPAWPTPIPAQSAKRPRNGAVVVGLTVLALVVAVSVGITVKLTAAGSTSSTATSPVPQYGPERTIELAAVQSTDCTALSPSGEAYIADNEAKRIFKYAPGSAKPTEIAYPLDNASCEGPQSGTFQGQTAYRTAGMPGLGSVLLHHLVEPPKPPTDLAILGVLHIPTRHFAIPTHPARSS
ncbi:serine/threonine-protein kinase [Nocardia sp. NPDC059240]|uniref:serine/threonine-protein kinase n=1 Tax=Nocardia sp. NPDC059240 TaxID=3346786 RepID=UPI00367FCE26